MKNIIIQKIICYKHDPKQDPVELNSQRFMAWESNLDPNIKPEKQHANPIKDSVEKPCIGQGRAGLEKEKTGSNQSNN